jgi:flagellar hook-length control protein FliK
MVREGRSSARIQLNPPELGRVDIRLEMDGPEARVQLVTQNAQVREGLEAMLPRLREMLSEQGLQLADASVSDQRGGGEADDEAAGRAHADTAAADGIEGDAASAELADAPVEPVRLDGLLDAYA